MESIDGLESIKLDHSDVVLVPAIPGLVLVVGYIYLNLDSEPIIEHHPIAMWSFSKGYGATPHVVTVSNRFGHVLLGRDNVLGPDIATTSGISTPDGTVYWDDAAVPAGTFEEVLTEYLISQRETYRQVIENLKRRIGADPSSKFAITISAEGRKSDEIPF